jgi:hypothetical protein
MDNLFLLLLGLFLFCGALLIGLALVKIGQAICQICRHHGD